jgi:hypothetical protein
LEVEPLGLKLGDSYADFGVLVRGCGLAHYVGKTMDWLDMNEEETRGRIALQSEYRGWAESGISRWSSEEKKKDKARIENKRRPLPFLNISWSLPVALGCGLVIIVWQRVVR